MLRFLFVLFPAVLLTFEPQPISPSPVVGFAEISFEDPHYQCKRTLCIWYPVDSKIEGTKSPNPWDLFKITEAAPSSQNKVPVIVISHGYLGNPHRLSWLIRDLVHNNFMVIGIQHRDLIDGNIHLNLWQRARDVSTMIDQFKISRFAQAAEMDKIAIAGYSLGGTTAIWVSGGRSTKLDSLIPGPESVSNPAEFSIMKKVIPFLDRKMITKNWRDPRVKAAFMIAPAWGWIFDRVGLNSINIPTYIIAPATDAFLVTKSNACFFACSIPHAIYQEIPGKSNHFVFTAALNALKQKEVNPSGYLNVLFEDDDSVDRLWIQQQTTNQAIRFFKTVLYTNDLKNQE